MSTRGSILASVIVLSIAAAGVWLQHPWQRPAATLQTTSCRLPVYLSSANTGGFLTVPGYAFTPVPDKTFTGEAKGPEKHWSYDAQNHRWLPVDHRMISPDGKWWAYATPLPPAVSASFHVVDRHGSDRTVWFGSGYLFALGWTKGGAAFVHIGPSPEHRTEYLLVDASTGRLRSLAPIGGDPFATDASGLWGTRNVPIGPQSDMREPIRSTVIHANIDTGTTVTWWDQTRPPAGIILGFDQDHQHPILALIPTPSGPLRYVRLTSPNTAEEITGDAEAAAFGPVSVLGDAPGIWFGDYKSAVWLWQEGKGLTRVAQVQTQTEAVVIAGPCR
jgi:hypothetical protein